MEVKAYYDLLSTIKDILQQDYRGVNVAIYSVASVGLALAIHRVRPVSKFSKASKIPTHFFERREPLKGTFVGVNHSPVQLLVDHRAPIYLPLWHSGKPPLPVKLWGVEIASGNAINWLQCVGTGQKVTVTPLSKENDSLISTVFLHLSGDKKAKNDQTLDVGRRLVELGFARASVPPKLQKNTFEAKLASSLVTAEKHAKDYRLGVWLDTLPPLPMYIILWRKLSKSASNALIILCKRALIGTKNIILRRSKSVGI